MKLTNKETIHLIEVINYILEFEHESYLDWVSREGRIDGHVFYDAKVLADTLEEYEGARENKSVERYQATQEFFNDTGN